MKTQYIRNIAVLIAVCLFSIPLAHSQLVDEAVVLHWPFSLGVENQTETLEPVEAQRYFNQIWVSNGSNLKYKDSRTTHSVTFTRLEPFVQNNSVGENDFIAFNLRPKTGLNFTPASVEFDCQRYGTDAGFIDVVWKSADGKFTTIATAVKPNRDNSGAVTHAVYDLSTFSFPVSNGDCGLYIYIYGLANGKQIGLANIAIKGKVEGAIEETITYSVKSSVYPVDAGTITTLPVGDSFDAGTSLTLTAKADFGYKFKEWRNSSDDTLLSTEPVLSLTLNSDVDVKAVFESVNTYSLSVNTLHGAAPYMISILPAGKEIDGKRMYEEGTVVTLTASSNPIFSFTNWGSGETSESLQVSMSSNQEISAVYSASEYIVGWDFFAQGGSSRLADFYSKPENETSSLAMRKQDGTLNSWLDKSISAAQGYYNRGAAVNWKPLADKYYFQIQFNAKDFTDIVITSGLLYNYNTYSIYNCEYSLDNVNFVSLGSFNLTAAQTWYDKSFTLPAEANHAETVYVRWMPDYTSPLQGTNAANNDGVSISSIYVTAQTDIYNDGKAPVLLNSVPTNGSSHASSTGKIVLNFDKIVTLTGSSVQASLGDKKLEPVVSGKTVTFSYAGLNYDTAYTFILPGNTLSDQAGNVLTSDVIVVFNTMSRPTVTKKNFDFVVGVDGDFKSAISAATAASSTGERFRIFFPNGEYNLGVNTGDGNQKTSVSLPNLSYVGQSADQVILYNKPTVEGIGVTATLHFTNTATNIYMQDMTLLNKMDYRTGSFAGRAVALQDQGNKNIYKNVSLLSNQDTYYSGTGRIYFEESSLHGTVDFICGGGDIFFNECLLYLENRSGNCIAAPATSSKWGYVFSNCTIDGFDINKGSYRLGRPWQNSPKAVYIHTKMNVLPTAEGWGEMAVVPGLFAEYNSMTSSGSVVDLTNRKKIYTYDGVSTEVNPYLTQEQASEYTLENVLGGTDMWQPRLYTEQAETPRISGKDNLIIWDDSNYVLCWAVFKDNVFVQFVTENEYKVPSEVTSGVYTVRAANEMGGLSEDSNAYEYLITGLSDHQSSSTIIEQKFYSIDGKLLQNPDDARGVVIIRSVYSDGAVQTEKTIYTTNTSEN